MGNEISVCAGRVPFHLLCACRKFPCFASASGNRGKGRAGRGHEWPWCLQRLLQVGCDTGKDKTPAKGRGWRRASKSRAPFGFLSVWGLSTPPHFSPRGSLPFPAALGGDFSSLLHLKKGIRSEMLEKGNHSASLFRAKEIWGTWS